MSAVAVAAAALDWEYAQTLEAARAERENAEQAARDSLLAFTRRTYPRYVAAWHHGRIAERLEAVERGEVRRLMIFMPPRHGKTELASIRFPAWYLGRNPDRRVITCSYSAALAVRLSRQARNLLTLPEWPWPHRLAADSAAAHAWDVAGHRGGLLAAGVGGPITGSGAHLLIIDDPVKNQEESSSPTFREAVWDWYTATAYTRLEDGGAVILVQTRWHHDDLAGRLLAAERAGGDRWEVLTLPALDPDGRPLWADKYDADALESIRRAVGSRVFAALYQQAPSDEESAIFRREWWRFYRAAPAHLDRLLLSWDMAFKDHAGADYVVGQVWGRVGADYYLLDQVRARLAFTATRQAVRTLAAKWPAATEKLIEDSANGPAVLDALRHEVDGLIAVTPDGSKLARAQAVSPLVEAGNVHLPDPALAPWVHDYLQEHAEFPHGAHDDQVDATSQALRRLTLAPREVVWG